MAQNYDDIVPVATYRDYKPEPAKQTPAKKAHQATAVKSAEASKKEN